MRKGAWDTRALFKVMGTDILTILLSYMIVMRVIEGVREYYTTIMKPPREPM